MEGELLSSGQAFDHMAETRGWTRGMWIYWVHAVEPESRRLRPDFLAGRNYLFLRSTLDAYRPARLQDGRRSRPKSFEDGMLTLRQVAERTGLAYKDVLRMAASGELPVDGKRSGTRYVLEKSLEAWERANGRDCGGVG